MRALGALVVVVGMATAHAQPARPRSDELKDPFVRISPCDASKAWAKVTSCLARQGHKVAVLHETDGAKLLALRGDRTTDATLGLYLLERGRWTRQGFYASTNPNTELLAFNRTEQAGYRIDVGSAVSTSVQLEGGSPMKAVLRRIFTTECRTGLGCRTLATSCDVLVDGKTLWAFRGRIMWTDGAVKVTGDTRIAGRLCTPPPSVLAPVDEALGDPLE